MKFRNLNLIEQGRNEMKMFILKDLYINKNIVINFEKRKCYKTSKSC